MSKQVLDNNLKGWVKQIENALDDYKPILAKNYTNLELNKTYKSELELQVQSNMDEYTESMIHEINN